MCNFNNSIVNTNMLEKIKISQKLTHNIKCDNVIIRNNRFLSKENVKKIIDEK